MRIARFALASLLVACGSDPAPAPPVPAPPPALSADEQAHRAAELEDWLAVDGLIGTCYEAYVAAHPGMSGAVAVRFTVHPDGHAREVQITQASPHDADAEACIVREVEAMAFTPSTAPMERTIERQFEP